MIRSRSKTRLVLIQIGTVAWAMLALGTIGQMLWPLSLPFNLQALPVMSLAAGLGGIGLGAFVAAGLMSRRLRGYVLFFVAVMLVLVNGLAYFGAYTLTHFNDTVLPGLAFAPKPDNTRNPAEFGLDYATERIAIDETAWLEAWRLPQSDTSQGTALLFPGNGGNKGHQLMIPAQVFHELGYHVLMVDFRGQGGSSGNSTTWGLRESEDVAHAMAYAEAIGLPRPYVLYGVSMGSTAILRAVDQGLQPDALVLELPFASLKKALKARLQAQELPSTGLIELLLFWGSLQHGYNGFLHNPVGYASSVTMPSLILQGTEDRWTTRSEIEAIYNALAGEKDLLLFPGAGHELLVTVDRDRWHTGVETFLHRHVGLSLVSH